MKKKIIVLTCLLFSCWSLLCAANTAGEIKCLTKGFDLQGGYKDFFAIQVTPLDATSSNFLAGMPFDLESETVEYSTADYKGLLIAKWQMLSNNPDFNITANCSPLVFDGKKLGETEDVVDYILTFTYPLSYYVNDHSEGDGIETVFSFSSDPTIIDNRRSNPITDSSLIDANRFVGTNDGKIFFKLTEEYKRTKDGVPVKSKDHVAKITDGYYTATVIINMEMVK